MEGEVCVCPMADKEHNRVRVRVAPSPTGDPHVGLAYISLFNFVFARKHDGDFILRIEDTDQARAKKSSDDLIISSLKWLGLDWTEGPDVGGSYGPYRQSQRLDIYREQLQKLLDAGQAYPCFCSPERLNEVRQACKAQGKMPKYDRHCLSLSQTDRSARIARGEPHVVRMKIPDRSDISFRDELRGEISISTEQLDDQVLLKSDGFPTYHLANVVDDHLMEISHVIRAEEWISSTPKHVLLYEMFGWDLPQFVHMPLLRNQDRSKISKRKNPVSLNYYKRKGILPGAMVNFLGLMGWSFGQDREIFGLDEMVERFSLADISLGGPVFDLVKLVAINKDYMQRLHCEEFVDYVRNQLFNSEYLSKLYPQVIKRLDCFEEFVDRNAFFFNGALSYDSFPVPKSKEIEQVREMVAALVEKLDDLYDWRAECLQEVMENHRAMIDWKPRDYFMTVRLIVTGRKDSPPLGDSMELVGREMVRFRMRDFLRSPAVTAAKP